MPEPPPACPPAFPALPPPPAYPPVAEAKPVASESAKKSAKKAAIESLTIYLVPFLAAYEANRRQETNMADIIYNVNGSQKYFFPDTNCAMALCGVYCRNSNGMTFRIEQEFLNYIKG
ncbi:MAG: hypothetical protein ACREBU_01830 [Nitrososphaera sp.]